MSPLFQTPVREYMSKGLIIARPDTTLDDVQRILEERDVSALPVLDWKDALVGIISTTDLLRASRIELDAARAKPRITPQSCSAGEVMRREVITIDEEAPLFEAARKMVERRVHRLVVTRDERPVAILSTRDAMRAVRFHHIETPLFKVISKPVVTVGLGDDVVSAIERLASANVHGLVVVDGEWPVGVFTHTEAIKARGLPHELLERTPVEEVMSYEMMCLDVFTPLYRVAGHAIETRVRRILAVENRRLRGIVTGFDLVRLMTNGIPE